ncbi:TetR/AcrR family transcriptional regulator [Actinotalea solisilvae]|uniref:TetR/AcrR family transcriptional regulator n=1 Tax=Actinotalea solisilvae TaxID=2072922 RepID=UPI0018F150A6|nr:TetR/AcrR family transcriptional regulator [Actinotalea solisilvae]
MPRPRTHDDALRVRLLEVTSEVISTGGAGAVTLRDVARRAGTSPSAVYALFGSRDDLLEAVVAEAFRRFADHLARAATSDDAAADLLTLGVAYRSSALADPHFYRVMFDRPVTGPAVPVGPAGAVGTEDGDDDGAVAPAGRATFGVLRAAVDRVLRDPRPQRPAADATEAALVLWGHVHGLVALELAGLLPGGPAERERRYVAALRASGAAVLGPAGPAATLAGRTPSA